MKPNLFEFATSELSQDAFLAWLFKWAEEENKKDNRDLHDCAALCLQQFFGEVNIGTVSSVQIWKQWNQIDLWVVVNDKFHLIIEDKVKTREHDNQLYNYKMTAKNWNLEQRGTDEDFKKNFAFVYFKTGKILEEEKSVAANEGWKLIEGKTVYNIFEKFKQIENPIFQDYKSHLKSLIEDETDIANFEYETLLKANNLNLNKFYRLLQGFLYKDAVIERQTKQLKWYYCGMQNIGYFYFTLKKTDLALQLYIQDNIDFTKNDILKKIKDTFTPFYVFDGNPHSNPIELCLIPADKWIAKDDVYWNLEKTIDNLHSFENKLWIDVLGNKKWN